MSEGDVSLIRDEDVLRRMWQQTEDFSRKKEIRAHMYRLREERLRNLYSPEPSSGGKGVEGAQTHVKSLLDQSFQGLKSKEVRDAGSPPKDYAYRGQDLKELSNAGWNVESERKTTDDGHTHVKSVQANIEGKYDVEGGRGQFAAVDHYKQAATEYQGDNTSLKRNESSSNTAAHEEVISKTDNGTKFSATTSSSSASKFQEVSSTKYEVPYTNDDYDLSRNTNRNEEIRHVTKTSDYEQNLRKSAFESGELVSKKIDYPDDHTKVIVETRLLPDGTRVTSTRREFRAPLQSTRSEQHSQSRSESKSYSGSSHHKSEVQSSKISREFDSRTNDIVDLQRQADDYDFKRKSDFTTQGNCLRTQSTNQKHHDVKHIDKKESSSKFTCETIDNRNDVIESQRFVDNSNINKSRQTSNLTQKDDYMTTERRTNEQYEIKVDESDRPEIITSNDIKKNKKNDYSTNKDDYSTTRHTNRYETKVDEIDRNEVIAGNVNQNIRRDVQETRYNKDNEECIHNITKDMKIDEMVDKKTTSDQYQTTYQAEFTQKKISNDWSPTQQAWASSLRADTPSTVRPTTRASSPGSRTYQSSTSSLRSSVSPDKTNRKAPSRDGSPSKVDRHSPLHTTTDRYSSDSTRSITETKTNRYTSPDRKPPMSPTRQVVSPDRKLQEGLRSSQSPEKRPQDYKPSSSPERKPKYNPTERKSTPDSSYARRTSPYRSNSPDKRSSSDATIRSSQNTDNNSGCQRPTDYARTISPSRPLAKDSPRPSSSPERKPTYSEPTMTRGSPGKIHLDKHPSESTRNRGSESPDRKPGYMRPTASKPIDTPKYTRPIRKSPERVPSQSPERKPYNKITNIKQDHYKFIDEETKMYTRSDQDDISYMRKISPNRDGIQCPRNKSPSPIITSSEHTVDYSRSESPSLRPTLRQASRSPSPPKGPVTFTQDQVDKMETTVTDISTKQIDNREDISKQYRPSKRDSPAKDIPSEPSSSKYGTYDKKHRTTEIEEVSTVTKKDLNDIKYDSFCHEKSLKNVPEQRREPVRKTVSPVKSTEPKESSPSKYETYDKKRHSEEVEQITNTKNDLIMRRDITSPKKTTVDKSPKKISQRDSVSPVKSPMTDAKYKHRTDFNSAERTTEQINKKDTVNDRSRQLVTPSTSPTRKPKTIETEPSTGQSSPTTSVSGFVYFSSPQNNRTIVTDLDDEEFFAQTTTTDELTTIYKRPDSLDVKRSPSPSKIPCRSPSPEKRVSSSKDSLPRKSSLKKPSTDFVQVSPIEKPPSSFLVSPTDEHLAFPNHKIVKKDNPDKLSDCPAKSKPPLERRETYEERCRKILGMVLDDSTKTTKKQESNASSPSVSPCYSPEPKSFTCMDAKEINKTNVTDFISREQEDTIKKTTRHTTSEDVVSTTVKSKVISRESSPAKLRDIISQTTVGNYDSTKDEARKNTISKIIRDSPDRETGFQKTKHREQSPDKISTMEREPRGSKPVLERSLPSKEITENIPSNKQSKEPVPSRPSISPDRKPGYMRPTAATTIKFELVSDSTGIQINTTPENVRQSPEKDTVYHITNVNPNPITDSPRNTSPQRSSTPERKVYYQQPTKISPERKPAEYSKTTKYESIETNENTQQVINTKAVHHKEYLDRETGYARATSPAKSKESSLVRSSMSPQPKPCCRQQSPTKEMYGPSRPKEKSPTKSSVSPDRKPGYMKPTAATINKYEEASEGIYEDNISRSVDSKLPALKSNVTQYIIKNPDESKRSRSPSRIKISTKVTEDITEFLQSEREQEILDRVQKSLRKLSPNREQRSSSREKSPGKTISLHDLDVTTETVKTDKIITGNDVTEKQTLTKTNTTRPAKPKENVSKDQKPATKLPSRNMSPTKRPAATKPDRTESPVKSRSISPKKPVSPTERPQSPQVSRPSGIKPREPIPSQFRKQTSPNKSDKVNDDVKKTTVITKQNSFTKTSAPKLTPKVSSPIKESEVKRTPTAKGINKENVSPRKEEIKVIRTTSDTTIKPKKTSPQRVRSKPEIHVSDMSTKIKQSVTATTTKTQKTVEKETQRKLAPKPKSATALNISLDEDDDIIIDVEQAKSSRENSPDRICPTPISFLEDVGTPRFPDEVSEPDDEFRKRTHQTIHEAESIVDDIVEICEDDELFVKRTDIDHFTESDECLLTVTDKVSKFTNKIETIAKPKDSTIQFKNIERRVHSDFLDKTLDADECLLSVSEKVNKFAKGARDINDRRSPSRKIIDEYDTETTYQDDYTKLSVNDKAHLFIETAENVKAPKIKSAQKIERPDLTNIEESLKSDECLLSVSDKVNKFVKSAEQFLNETQEAEEKEKIVKDEYEKIMKHIVQDDYDDIYNSKIKKVTEEMKITDKTTEDDVPSFVKETASSHSKVKDYVSPNLKPTEKKPIVKITTLRSSEAVKKAKALFENIGSNTQIKDTKITKLTDIGVLKKSPRSDSSVVHPSIEDGSPNITDFDSEVDAPQAPTHKNLPLSGITSLTKSNLRDRYEEKPRRSPTRLTTQSPEVPRTKSPIHQSVETTTTTTRTVTSRYPTSHNESPRSVRLEPEDYKAKDEINESKHLRPELDKEKPLEKVPSYQRPTKNSQAKEEKTIEETEVSTRRGSGKFGVELRKTSVERSTISSERRRSSTEHHQPCIEDIFDLDLLEQMLEKVVGYEQRRRIRAQMRIAKKRMETEHTNTTYTRTSKQTTVTKTRSPERRPQTKSPERQPKPTAQKTTPDHAQLKDQVKPLLNGHAKDLLDKRPRTQSPEKFKAASKTRSPIRQPSPEKKTRTASPSKTLTKPKTNRFNEYASAYMKKVGLNETDKLKFSDVKMKEVEDQKTEHHATNKSTESKDYQTVNQFEEKIETKTTSTSKTFTQRTSSKDTIEIVHVNGKRSPSPEKKHTRARQAMSPSERLYYRSPSPDFKRPRSENTETIIKTVHESEFPKTTKKETIIKTVYEERPKTKVPDVEKKQPTPTQEEKPSWVTNRNLKKTTSETRTFSSKKVENEKPKYRAQSPSKVISKPIDVITSSYGPGPLDAEGRPLFGIKALRNGATNYQVKGTVIRQEFHSRNGSDPEGTVSVTAYSTEPEDLERLLRTQGERPSRIHGLAAITTTKKFGGETGTTLKEAHSKEERASLEQFTHSDRRTTDSRVTNLSDTRVDSRQNDSKTSDSRSIDRSTHRSADYTRSLDKKEVRGVDRRETRKTEDRRERREDKKTVRQSSVKSLTEKYIKSASDTSKSERSAYPKAGLILRTATMKDNVSSDSSAHAGLGRTDSEHSLVSVEDTVVTRTELTDDHHTTTKATTNMSQERSFLDSTTKVTGVQDILTRMKNADIVIQDGDTCEDSEARALLNKFLGATVLMAGMQSYVTERPGGKLTVKQEPAPIVTAKPRANNDVDLEQCWDERVLRKLLEESSDYEQRRRLRARIRTLMAEQEACASAVTEALAAAGEAPDVTESSDTREEKEVTVTSSARKNSSEKIVSSSTTTKTSKVIESMTRPAPKPVSPFAKFRQLEKQNSTNSPKM